MTTTITLTLPADAPISAVRDLADSIGCDLRLMADGSYAAIPRHTNASVVKFPRRRRQYIHADLPTGPEAA